MLVGGGKKRYLMGGLRRNGWMRKKKGEKSPLSWIRVSSCIKIKITSVL